MALAPISVEGHTTQTLTAEVQEKMQQGLLKLHQLTVKSKNIT